jgi:DNA-binding response OmpR family regulator
MAGLKNVLIIEDDAMIRELYRAALVDADFTIEVAGSASEAYEKLKIFHPDCVFLDVMLPNVSGLEILKELRTNPVHGCQEAKIVILSNLAQNTIADNAMANGADGYIIKADIHPQNLPEVIKSLEEDQ